MFTTQSLQEVIVWVLTYSVHSTLLLGTAWLVTRRLSAERIRLRECIWKTAILGALVSASLQVGLDVSPVAGRLEWSLAGAELHPESVEAHGVLTSAAAPDMAALEWSWERVLMGLWALGGFLGLGLLLFTWRRVTDRLAGRTLVREGHALECLQRLSKQAGLRQAPRLTWSRSLKSPATIGVFLPQICVPDRALAELPPDQQEALIAHELAHILRADPLWLFVCGLVERLFFFQPLNRVARRELEELAEFLSDDWAAQNTRNELGLARCLTEVATWVLERRPAVALVPMASRNSRLAARIGRLLDEDRTPQDHRRSPRAWLLPASALTAAVLLLPGAAAIADSEAPHDSHHKHAGPRMRPSLHAQFPASSDSQAAPANGAITTTTTTTTTTGDDQLDQQLDDLLLMLDSEVEQLASEVGELSESILEESHPTTQRVHSIAEISERMRNLRQRRERLRELLPALKRTLRDGAPSAASSSAPAVPHLWNPKQEESR